MGSNFHYIDYIDYSNSETICKSSFIEQYLDNCATETTEYFIDRQRFFKSWNEFIENFQKKEYTITRFDFDYTDTYDCFVDLAEVLVNKTKSFPEVKDNKYTEGVAALIW